MSESTNSTNRPYKPTKKEDNKMSEEKREKDSVTEEKLIVTGAIELAPESRRSLYEHVREEIIEALGSGENFSSDELVGFLSYFPNYSLLNIIKEAVSNAIENTDPNELNFADSEDNFKKLKALKAVLDLG